MLGSGDTGKADTAMIVDTALIPGVAVMTVLTYVAELVLTFV